MWGLWEGLNMSQPTLDVRGSQPGRRVGSIELSLLKFSRQILTYISVLKATKLQRDVAYLYLSSPLQIVIMNKANMHPYTKSQNQKRAKLSPAYMDRGYVRKKRSEE